MQNMLLTLIRSVASIFDSESFDTANSLYLVFNNADVYIECNSTLLLQTKTEA